MTIFMTAALLALIPIGAVLVYLLRTLSARQDSSFSLEESLVLPSNQVQPMGKLLRRDDFEFLAGQPGYSPSLGRRFRTERRRVFRGYLRCLPPGLRPRVANLPHSDCAFGRGSRRLSRGPGP